MKEHGEDTAVLEQHEAPEHAQAEDREERDVPEEHAETIEWLEDEFPEWSIEVGVGQTMNREDVRLWVARREGHHPQSETSAGKLYSRLTEYTERHERRFPSPN